MISRFVAWKTEGDELLTELNEYLESLSEEELKHLAQDGFLDPASDPSVIFDLRYPFPGTSDLAKRLYAQYGISSSHLESDTRIHEMGKGRRLDFLFVSGGVAYQEEYHIQNGIFELVEIAQQNQEAGNFKVLHRVQIEFRIQWALPLAEDYDWHETPIEYLQKSGRIPISFQQIPGISMPELAENFCEFLALRELCNWAKQNLPAL